MSETRIPEALALLREKGWCKGALSDDEGRHCIMGAGFRVHGIELAPHRPITKECLEDEHAIREVLLAQHGTRHIAVFNDDPATTFEMVEAILEKAALERGGAL